MASKVPSALLLSYFDATQVRLRRLAADPGVAAPSSRPDLSWHRSRIIEAQLSSLDEATSGWRREHNEDAVRDDDVRDVLRRIGAGDFTRVAFEDEGDEIRQRLADAVESTNDLARLEFARSILSSEWIPADQPQGGRELRSTSVSGGDVMEYCGLAMAAVRLPEIQTYLRTGHSPYGGPDGVGGNSAEDRLRHIQSSIWRALGLDPVSASDELMGILTSGKGNLRFDDEAKAAETLTKYTSVMTVAATNAAMSSIVDEGEENDRSCGNNDGTTRVVDVSYSEKIITLPTNGEGEIMTTPESMAAPASETIDEHEHSREKQALGVAREASALQERLWGDFESLPQHEREKKLEAARNAHLEFMEKMASTPPGRERVLLMQGMDAETQGLLVIYKLWCSQNVVGVA